MNVHEKEQIISAIEKLGPAVSAAQIAKSTGLNGNLVFSALREIAAATGSNLQVVKDGEISFRFPYNFVDLYHSRDKSIWWDEAMRSSFELCFFVARIAFAVMLLVMIYLFHPPEPRFLIYYLMIIFGGIYFELDESSGIRTYTLTKGNQPKGIRQSLGLGKLSRLFAYRYRENKLDLRGNLLLLLNEDPTPDTQGTSLFNVCFSFVFGDANPNPHFDELKWQVVAEVIRQHNGAVVTDQLAPYLCFAPDDEDAMLPVLQRFNGIPKATESGNLVYLFPDLMKTEQANFRVPSYLKEKPWRFYDISFPQRLAVWVVSTLFLWLGYYQYLHPDDLLWIWKSLSPEGLHLWELIVPFSIFFYVVPALRFTYITLSNNEIEERNKLRRYFAEILHKPDDPLFHKLLERNEFQLEETLIQSLPEDVVYTTHKALDEQGLDV